MADSNTMTGSVVTGATSGGVSPVVVYYDVTTGNLYDSNGTLFGNNTFSAFLDNNFTLELHYVQDISTSTNPEEWKVWDGLEGQSISSTLAFDNDFLHAIEGKAHEDTLAGSSTFKVFVKDLNKDTLDPVGVLVINPFGSEDDKMMVTYSSFEASTDISNLYTFTIQDVDGLPKAVAKDTSVRVSAPLYLQVDCNSIYEANIPAHYGEGVFNFPINVISRKLIKELDYRSLSGVSGTMEHKIYIKKESLAGISVDGTEYTRDNSGDTAAQDVSYYAWQYTSGGETITLYTKSEVPVLNETVYKKTMEDRIIEANAVIYTDSSTASQTVIKRGTSAPETYTKNNELNEYAPYMFCYWTNERWTRGNEINADTPVYNIVDGTAVKENYTCDPVYSTGFVLYRTFNFPFIVKNLIERDGISLHIPVEDTDWVRAYVISIVKDNMEEIVERAGKGTFGVVKVGDNIDVSTGIISVKTASTSDKGLVKVGTNIDVADGTISVKTGSTSDKGLVKVGTNIDVAAGVISVKDASETDKGVLRIATSAEVTGGTDTNLAITPATLKGVIDNLQNTLVFNTPLNLDITGETVSLDYSSPLKLDGNGKLTVDIGDGLDVGVTGSTNANKLIVNEASVKEVLEDVVDGGTESAVNEIVTADNLRGAFSVGQAVDVSCEPYNNSGSISYNEGGFLNGFTATMISGTTVGYYDVDTEFPKLASHLNYLLIANVAGSGTITLKDGSTVALSNTPKHIAIKFDNDNSKTAYFYASGNVTANVINWRQYEVTALTDEAIAYIAQLPDPDAFFRSNTVDTVKDKYLVKNDMVCPWIKTINMPDNSDLTVAAGLSYKIKYTNDDTHTITADTIPTDAYGWDTHIQMFIKGTSAINFQAPLVLMDALTPNAGHNMVVKWRNGYALVYVDDTNAGYIVVKASGTGAGTLNDAISNDYTDYVIFSGDLAGIVIDAGDATFAGGTGFTAVNILGNGTEDTVITGNISATSGKTINFQSLTIDGGTLGGAGTMNLDDTAVEGSVYVDSPTTMRFNTVNVLNGTVSGSGKLAFADGTTVTSVVPSGSTIGTGLIAGFTVSSAVVSASATFENISITDFTPTGSNAGIASVGEGKTVVFRNCYFRHTNTSTGRFIRANGGDVVLDGCISEGSGNGARYLYVTKSTSTMYIYNSNLVSFTVGTGNVVLSGNVTFGDFTIGVSGGQDNPGVITITDGSAVAFDSVSFSAGKIYTHVVGHATLIAGGLETELFGCTFRNISSAGRLVGNPNITVDSMSVWSAENAVFSSPLDATAADTIKLSGTTFTGASKTLNTNRIQLPASTTVSLSGNTNADNTKILDAGLIVVGDNPESPSGSATVVNASGTSSTVTGIGTYIDKEGDNDFVATNITNVVAVDASTTGAKCLGTVLSATTGDTGANRFAKIDSGAVAVVNAGVNAVNKQIITHDYEPILGGTFSLTSATMDEATKTVAIQSGGTMSIVDIRGGKGSVIDLGGTFLQYVQGGITHGSLSGVTLTGGVNSTLSGGALLVRSATIAVDVSGCLISGNRTTSNMYTGGVAVNGATVTLTGTTITGNYADSIGGGLSVVGSSADVHVVDCEITGNTARFYGHDTFVGQSASVVFSGCTLGYGCGQGTYILAGSNTLLGSIAKEGNYAPLVTLTSGAILDLIGNENETPIAPGGGITFEQGSATVYPSAGSASAVNVNIAGGTFGCSTITNGGVLVMPNVGFPITDGATLSGNATIDIPKQSVIPNATFNGVAFTGLGHIVGYAGATITLSNCTVSVPLRNRTGVKYGNYVFAGNCTVGSVSNDSGVTSGAVTISSGASINLTSSINPGAGITVLTGGCTVNGVAVEPGTYTSFVSSGGSVVINQ